MKKLLLILIVIISFTACNDSSRTDPGTGCNVIVWSYLTPGQEATLTGFGYNIGDIVDWNRLDAEQKSAFTLNGLDSTKCYFIAP